MILLVDSEPELGNKSAKTRNYETFTLNHSETMLGHEFSPVGLPSRDELTVAKVELEINQ
jgi:hypothetical protein